jgi:hypothetical protein
MDDIDFDPFVSKRVDQERPPGPFRIREELPVKIFKWKHRIHPDTKKPQLMIDFNWQRVAAQRIIASFVSYVQDWTTNVVKKREALDKRDISDNAHALFASDPEGRFLPDVVTLRALLVVPAATATNNQIVLANTATSVAQTNAINGLIADINSPIENVDRPILLSFCSLTTGEFEIYRHFVHVFDSARCHFFFDIISVEMQRFLNAERIASASAAVPVTLRWRDYLSLTLSRLTDTKESEDLLLHLLKIRDDQLPVYLWIAERRAERDLLTTDGITLPEAVWLSYVLDFVTSDEHLILQVPADKDRAAFNGGAGYDMAALEASLATTDPRSFRKFHQNLCTGPLAKRLLSIHKPVPLKPLIKDDVKPIKKKVDEKVDKAKQKNLPNPPDKKLKQQKPLEGDALKRLDSDSSLPQKDGKLNKTNYDKWSEGSLRKRLWDRMTSRKCVRCASDKHLRSACTEARQVWEDDFDLGPSFWVPKSQQRCQWTPDFPSSNVLHLSSDYGMIAIDTCSDVSTAVSSILLNVRSCPPLSLHHVGGTTTFDTCGDLLILDRKFTLYAVSKEDLPPGFSMLLGMPDIRELGVSLDFAIAHPGCALLDCVPDRGGKPLPSKSFPRILFPLWVIFIAMILFATAFASVCPDFLSHQQAMLPSSSNGHSLFALPPFSVRTDQLRIFPNHFAPMKLEFPFNFENAVAHDPPEESDFFLAVLHKFRTKILHLSPVLL